MTSYNKTKARKQWKVIGRGFNGWHATGCGVSTAYSLHKLNLVHLHSYAWPMMRATLTVDGRKYLAKYNTTEEKP